MPAGLIERYEYEYVRHGTLCLMADFEVATGEVASFTIGPTRTELDFANHIQQTVSGDPDAVWVFVADNLDTHRSATLVEQVAKWCGITDDLGKGSAASLREKPRAPHFWPIRVTGYAWFTRRSTVRGSIRSRSGSACSYAGCWRRPPVDSHRPRLGGLTAVPEPIVKFDRTKHGDHGGNDGVHGGRRDGADDAAG
ncbi:MAG: transposase [Myxococcota bacterium]